MANREQIEQRIKFCQKQAEYYFELFKSRREYEWKITLGFWATLIASSSIIRDIKDSVWVLFLLGIFFTIFWIKGIWVANFNDKSRAFHFLRQAELLITENAETIAEKPDQLNCTNLKWWFGFLIDWSALFQITFTLLIIIGLYKLSLT